MTGAATVFVTATRLTAPGVAARSLGGKRDLLPHQREALRDVDGAERIGFHIRYLARLDGRA